METDADRHWKRRQEATKRRNELRARAVAALGGKCQICGYDKSPAAFDFHHIDPMEKDFAISERMTSWSAIQRELEKCVLLCCRCHREVHDGWHPNFLHFEDSDRSGYDTDLEEEPVLNDGLPAAEEAGFVGPGLFT